MVTGTVHTVDESSRYEEIRQRHLARLAELLAEQVAAIDWSEAQLRAAQDARLRVLVSTAVAQSAWHRKRLSHIDVRGLTARDLGDLPTMTKTDLMENFDDIVTDRRLSREICERHVDALTSDTYLLDEFHVIASGGSSGQRGVFVFDWDAWAICFSCIGRFSVRERASDPALAAIVPVIATVAAAKASHLSAAIGQTFAGPHRRHHRFPVSEPIERIVAGINQVQPTILAGYSSFLPRLAAEARAGRLRISPSRIMAISEPLLPEARADLEATWGVAVWSSYGTSEGLQTGFCGHGSHLPDDLCLVESVGPHGVPVPVGTTSERVYFTNLYNPLLPLIRFEVTDEITILDGSCPCGSVFRRIADPLGRLDDSFVYANGTSIHPHLFRACLGRQHLIEYQVRQTPHGADVTAVNSGDIDTNALARQVEDALRDFGLPEPKVTITLADHLDRQTTGKLKRFIPMG